MKKILLVLEQDKGTIYGRVHYKGSVVEATAKNYLSLEKKLKKLLHDTQGLHIEQIEFKYAYCITAFFQKFTFLNISAVAQKAEINPALLRQYASGVKKPSLNQSKKIEAAIHRIAKELLQVSVYGE
jgi:hypothetical protein